ncbi:MAG: TIGR03013 family XrtA/PEP-CTERM system glycosyltransferase [Candidatus Korobacteraceae bacterium]
MVRLFSIYLPVRTLVLMLGEALIFVGSFVLAAAIQWGPESAAILNGPNFAKILAISAMAVVCAYYLDLYDPRQLNCGSEAYSRMLIVLALLAFLLAAIGYFFPSFLMGRRVFVVALIILTISLLSWRAAYAWLVRKPYLRERVYVLGAGDRARTLIEAIRERPDVPMEIIGWAGALGNGSFTRETLGEAVEALHTKGKVDRVIVALNDRRGTLPVRELLELRLRGVRVEDAASVLEKMSGKIEVDALHPSALIFSEGFRLHTGLLVARRLISVLMSLTGLLLVLPLIPFVVLAIKLTSDGPVLFRQERVGRYGETFTLFKFRTMRQDAESGTGPVWAADNDPRITPVGRFLRKSRLDEIPQLWNVLKGDMGFVGPRPERPEFVQWLTEAIPYYHLRHMIRPGVTGWAQVQYQYGASLEQSKQKLQYDLYYIKHMSLMLDLVILFKTVKTVITARGL